jgi:hypothetical protein
MGGGTTLCLENNLVAFILTLACFVVLIPNLGSAQADKVKNSMAALKAETGKLGAPAVQSTNFTSARVRYQLSWSMLW